MVQCLGFGVRGLGFGVRSLGFHLRVHQRDEHRLLQLPRVVSG